ncbi:hypothetical protein [Celerinatantimonas sp. MCCC 1A17872]|uniref:hypothetical protein n=1 Tax=Celerinatantimonas sp. MCCC 1A17872 TaxID=3177514 RepID=UPI0038C75B82
MLTAKEHRQATLIAAGVNGDFLEALKDDSKLGKLQYFVQPPVGGYNYLPSIMDDYDILKGSTITPICDGGADDEFFVMLTAGSQHRFVRIELEADKIYNDFADSFELMLAYILLDFYGFDENMTLDDHIHFATTMGLKNADVIFKRFATIYPDADLKQIEQWQKQQLPALLGQ